MLDFAVLGPLRVQRDGRELPIEGHRIRTLLVRLVVAGSRPVSAERLIDDLWSGDPPPGARSTLPSHVSRLRRLLGPERLPHTDAGYLLALASGDQLDVAGFESDYLQARRAAGAGDPALAVAAFDRALSRWRGPALADAHDSTWAQGEIARLEELRLVATEGRLDALLELGRGEEVAAAAARLVEEQPLRERLWAQLMLAQYRGGRQSEALRTYQRLRRQLGEELGIEPSQELAALESAILRHSPELLPGPSPGGAGAGGVLRRVRAGSPELPLVGREAQLATLQTLLRRSDPGRPSLALIRGDAGCGKSRLLTELGRRARDAGMAVVACSAEGDDAAPYLPLGEIARQLLGGSRPNSVSEGAATDLSWLLPELGPPPPTARADLGVARARMFEALLSLLGSSGHGEALLVTVDDAHRLGRGSAAFLSVLLRRELPRPLTLVAAFREGTGEGPPGELLHRDDTVALEVGRLGADDLATLLESTHSEAGHGRLDETARRRAVRHLAWESGGIPLLVREVLASPAWAEKVPGEPAAMRPLPDFSFQPTNPAVQAVLAQRTGRLSAPAQRLLQAGAVAGEDFDLGVLVRLSRQPEEEVVDLLDEVIGVGGILVEAPEADRYRWDHALIRDAFLRGLSHARASRLHRATAEVLAERGALPAAARHALAAAGTMAADRVGELAIGGTTSALGALDFELAKDLAAEALQRITGLASARRGELLLHLGRAESMSGQPDRAEAAWGQAADCARKAGDLELLGEVALSTDLHGRYFAPSDLRWALLTEAADALGPGWSALRVRVVSAWLSEATMPRRRAAELARAREVMNEARRLGDDRVLASAMYAGFLVTRTLSPRTDHVLAEEMERVAERLDDPGWLLQARLFRLIGAVVSGDGALAERYVALLEDAAAAVGTPRATWNAELALATWDRLRGRDEEADRRSRHAAAIGTEHGLADAQLGYAVQQFRSALFSGALPPLRPALDQVAVAYPEIPAWRIAAALCAAADGDPDSARQGLAGTLAGLDESPCEETWLLSVCLAVELVAAVGASREAVVHLEHLLVPYAGQVVVIGAFVGEFGPVDRYRGLLALARGDGVEARWLFDSAVETCRALGAPGWVAHVRRDRERQGDLGGPAVALGGQVPGSAGSGAASDPAPV